MTLKYPIFKSNTRIIRASKNKPALRKGEKGDAVKIIQAAIIDLGYKLPVSVKKTGLPDGIYGNETWSVIKEFQTKEKLADKDGIAGEDTIKKMDELLLIKFPPAPPAPVKPIVVSPISSVYQIGVNDPPLSADKGAGKWNSKPATATAMVQKALILNYHVHSSVIIGDDAADHMWHYLMNSGNDYDIDLQDMIDSVPSAMSRYRAEIAQFKKFVEKLPVGVHSVTSKKPNGGYNLKSENWNWFFAVGGYSTWGKGKITVSKGAKGKQYRAEFEYKFYDRYNWDTGKSVTIAGIEITDEFMGEFHRQGLAKEFNMYGSVKRKLNWQHGDKIPSTQFLPPGRR